ncbi:MAG: hypothetical protein HN778_13030 [Prolixibacteraceae bacterium]|nr:hypothetical protein [Prolixibacteraceae bacterium]
MTQPELNNISANQLNEDDSIDIKKIIFKFLRYWYWFVLSVILAGGFAYTYVRYTTPIYEISSTLLVEEDQVSSPLLGGAGATGNVFQGLGGMNSMRNIFNQMVVLKSTPVVAKTLDKLDFEVSYYSSGRVAVSESYTAAPFLVLWEKDHPQLIEADFNLTIHSDGKLAISAEGENGRVYNYQEDKIIKNLPVYSFSRAIEPGTRLTSDEFSFTILLNEHFNPLGNNNFKFRFHTKSSLVRKYRNLLNVSLPENETSILHITLRDYNRQKGIDFLSMLTNVYQLDNLGKKNENANRTIQFISIQLQSISDSLNISETRMESFQSENQLLDISMQSQQLLEQMNTLDNEKIAMEVQNKYYHYLRDYFMNTQELETLIAPSAMGIQDPLLNSLILQLNDLITQKSSQTSIRQNSQHPTILRLNAQIESVKNSLLENTNSIVSQSDMTLDNLKTRIRSLEAEVRRLPATERDYVNIERGYKLDNETYTFLLQKLSEAQIAKASNIPDSQVIEEPQILGGPVEPQSKKIYAIAILLGLAFPAGIIFLLDFFNNKIMSQEEIEAITNYPIIGHIFHNEREFASRTLVLDKPNSPATEPYRAIRNKLNLMAKGKEKPIIAVTSTFPKEGKSYNAINIASSFALMRKNAVILDLDLRNSKMNAEFELKSDLGAVNILLEKQSWKILHLKQNTQI